MTLLVGPNGLLCDLSENLFATFQSNSHPYNPVHLDTVETNGIQLTHPTLYEGIHWTFQFKYLKVTVDRKETRPPPITYTPQRANTSFLIYKSFKNYIYCLIGQVFLRWIRLLQYTCHDLGLLSPTLHPTDDTMVSPTSLGYKDSKTTFWNT